MTEAPRSPPAWWDLAQDAAYRDWRAAVLAAGDIEFEPVPVADPAHLTPVERQALLARLDATGAACYRTRPDPQPSGILALGTQLGLTRLSRHQCAEPDGVARLTARQDAARRFIPYTRQPLRWHTDGYYLTPNVRSFILHCVAPAAAGGANRLLDPRRLYIALRDEAPELVQALIHPEAFTVPAHRDGGRVRRPEFRGPVFSVDDRRLHLRYTERAEHIRWRTDTAAARARIRHLLGTLPAACRELRLEAGDGLIAHNVLHCRSAYDDHAERPRLLYRARYLDYARPPC